MWKTLCAAVALLLAATTLTTSHEWTGGRSIEEVVSNTNYRVGRDGGWCSGTLVSLTEGLILTNRHCLRGEAGDWDDLVVSQKFYDEELGFWREVMYVAEVAAVHEKDDIALLDVRGPVHNEFATEVRRDVSVARGENVYIVGNPAGLYGSVGAGVVSYVRRNHINPEGPRIQVDASGYGGNSGGALYLADGMFVGVPAEMIGQVSHLIIAVPVWSVVDFLVQQGYGHVVRQ